MAGDKLISPWINVICAFVDVKIINWNVCFFFRGAMVESWEFLLMVILDLSVPFSRNLGIISF